MEPINVEDFHFQAREKLTPQAYDYIAGAADDEVTLGENRLAFERWQLRPRMLVDVSSVELETNILGTPLSFPVLLAPTGFQRLSHPDGEIASARAAAQARTLFIQSSLGSCRAAEVAAAVDAPRWYQLYCARDRSIAKAMVERAVSNNYQALCLTVDVPVVGRRERDFRNPFRLPPEAVPSDLLDFVDLDQYAPGETDSALNDLFDRFFDPTLTWKDLDWLRSISSLPLVLKGILTAEDARLAIENGVDAIIVSNHGGRQLDTVPATLDVMAEIADAVDGRVPLLLDGGIRRGTDIIKALALGADAVLIGRPYVWGLAAEGEEGVLKVLEMLRQELATAAALIGCPKISKLDQSYLRRVTI